MAQGGGGKHKHTRAKTTKQARSAGSARKILGHTGKNMRAARSDYLRDKAGKSFITAIENEMATRVPSDQRAKLTLLKAKGAPIKNRKQGKKKPLTRGRSRKSKGSK